MFIHEAILDALLFPCVNIPCEEFGQAYQKLIEPDSVTGKVPLELDFEVCMYT